MRRIGLVRLAGYANRSGLLVWAQQTEGGRTMTPDVHDQRRLPDRLNLAVGHRCYVSCPGCYSFFGNAEPDLDALLDSVARLVDLGVTQVTLSGGDPLTIRGLRSFLSDLRSVGVASIKLDTVGTALALDSERAPRPSARPIELRELIDAIDFLGIPLDGVSAETATIFRTGRSALLAETNQLLDAIDALAPGPIVIVNTVAHAMNLAELRDMLGQLIDRPSVGQWNVFQYTPTDQATPEANATFRVDNDVFARLGADLRAGAGDLIVSARSTNSRLGDYLLVNSDGEVWLPDAAGNTIQLGLMYGREAEVLDAWAAASTASELVLETP